MFFFCGTIANSSFQLPLGTSFPIEIVGLSQWNNLGFLNKIHVTPAHLQGMKFGSGLQEVSRGRPGDSLYNPCLSVLYENGYMGKSEHFQLSSSIKLSSKKCRMKGEQISRASPTRGGGSRARQLEPSSVSQATLRHSQGLLHIPQNTVWNPRNILLLRSKILKTQKPYEILQGVPSAWVAHFDWREAPVIKATLVQTHYRECYIICNKREMTKSRQSCNSFSIPSHLMIQFQYQLKIK